MNIDISSHFTYKKLFRFVLPSIGTMVFLSTYSIVDALFISNYVGDTAFASINLIFPALMIFGCLGSMLGSGGSALIGKKLGEGHTAEARGIFSAIIIGSFLSGIVLSIGAYFFIPFLTSLMGAWGEMQKNSILYGQLILLSFPLHLLQRIFHSLVITAGKPSLGLYTNIISGVSNIIFDFILIACFNMGITGAALATVIAEIIGGLIPVVYFFYNKTGSLFITQPRWDIHDFTKICTNGLSPLLTNLSMSIVIIVYNYQLLHFLGQNGVAAFGIIMYTSFVLESANIGYAMGTAPIVSYNYGAQNHSELQNIFKKSLFFYGITRGIITILSFPMAPFLAHIFVGYNPELYQLTIHGFYLYCLSFITSGFNIYASSFFTALNNGLISATLSTCRSVLFELIAITVLPIFWGAEGIWLSATISNLAAFIIAIYFWIHYREKYHYI